MWWIVSLIELLTGFKRRWIFLLKSVKSSISETKTLVATYVFYIRTEKKLANDNLLFKFLKWPDLLLQVNTLTRIIFVFITLRQILDC